LDNDKEANSLEEADVALGKEVASWRDEPVVKWVAEVGKIGDQEPLYVLGCILTVLGIILRHRRLENTGIFVVGGVAAADASKRLIKRCVRRTRPHVLLDEGRYASEAGGSDKKPEQSFPSGHMAGTVAASRALARRFPATTPYVTAATIIIALARLAKGAHWPLDVAAGALVGWIAEAGSNAALKKIGEPELE
jgi:membrane-associated phospholipid phosphatase